MASSLQWTQVSSGLYERAVDDTEQYYLSACSIKSPIVNKGDWYLSAGIKLEYNGWSFIEDALWAWNEVRYTYPTTAAKCDNNRWSYQVASDHEIKSWQQETFHIYLGPVTGRQLISEESVSPAQRMVLYVLPHTHELVIQGPHTHMDGFGLIKTFNCILNALRDRQDFSEGADGRLHGADEAQNLTPPLSIACKSPTITDEDKMKWDGLIEPYCDPANKVFLPVRNPDGEAGISRVQSIVYDESSTTAILRAAQQHSTSLAAVVQAAISLGACKTGHYPSQKIHATQGLYGAREHVDVSVCDESRIVSPMVLGVPLIFNLQDSFIDTAKEVSKKFRYGREDAFALKCGPLWATELPRMLRAPMPEGHRIKAEAQLSFLGPIDGYLEGKSRSGSVPRSGIQCKDYWCGLDLLSANVVTWGYVFHGKLHITSAYNETYHSEESRSTFLRTAVGLIDEGLAIDSRWTLCLPGQEEWNKPTISWTNGTSTATVAGKTSATGFSNGGSTGPIVNATSMAALISST